jgi:hypothetical protein
VYPEDDANLPGELTLLREALPEDTTLLVGGRAIPAYRETLVRLNGLASTRTEPLPFNTRALL